MGLSTVVALAGGVPATAATKQAPDFDATPPQAGKPFYAEQQLAANGEGFPNYRIPALAVTNRGDILAAYDGRPTAIDAPGPNSILQRRSTDDGATWGEQTIVHGGKREAPIEGYSDPSYLVDRSTGDIFNFHVKSFDQGFGGSRPGVDPQDRNVLHAEVSVSHDDGLTWQHEVITSDVTADLGWRSRFAASGQGIQLKYGKYAGRLLQQYTIINGAGVFQAVSVYSDDHGRTWKAGEPVGSGMDENKTVELSDGRVMLNSRDSGRSGYRKVAISDDGGVTYGKVTVDRELPDPANNASIARAFPNAPQGSDRAKVLLFSNAGSTSQRANGIVRMSFDDGETWPVARVFQPDGMAYSTLATLPDGNVGLLYEPDGGNGGIRFARFNLAWLQGVAAPLTAENLTVERGGLRSHGGEPERVGPPGEGPHPRGAGGLDVRTDAAGPDPPRLLQDRHRRPHRPRGRDRGHLPRDRHAHGHQGAHLPGFLHRRGAEDGRREHTGPHPGDRRHAHQPAERRLPGR